MGGTKHGILFGLESLTLDRSFIDASKPPSARKMEESFFRSGVESAELLLPTSRLLDWDSFMVLARQGGG